MCLIFRCLGRNLTYMDDVDAADRTDPGFEILHSDPDLTPPGGATAGTFSTVADAFWSKVRNVKDMAYYLSEIPPADRDAAMWRLAAALTEVIDVGTDLRALVITMVGEQPAVEI